MVCLHENCLSLSLKLLAASTSLSSCRPQSLFPSLSLFPLSLSRSQSLLCFVLFCFILIRSCNDCSLSLSLFPSPFLLVHPPRSSPASCCMMSDFTPSSSTAFVPSSSLTVLHHLSSLYHLPKSISDLESSEKTSTDSSDSSSSSSAPSSSFEITPEMRSTVKRDSNSLFSPWMPDHKSSRKADKKSNGVHFKPDGVIDDRLTPIKETKNPKKTSSSLDNSRESTPRSSAQTPARTRARGASFSIATTVPSSASSSTSSSASHSKRNSMTDLDIGNGKETNEKSKESEQSHQLFAPHRRRLSVQNEAQIWSALMNGKKGEDKAEDDMTQQRLKNKRKGAERGRSKSVIVMSIPACPPTPPSTPLPHQSAASSKPIAASESSGASLQRRFSMPSHLSYFSFETNNVNGNNSNNGVTPNESTPLLGMNGQQKKEETHRMSDAMMSEIQQKVSSLKLQEKELKQQHQVQQAALQHQAVDFPHLSKKRRYSLPSAQDEWTELSKRVYGNNEGETTANLPPAILAWMDTKRKCDASTQTEQEPKVWINDERVKLASSAKKPSQQHHVLMTSNETAPTAFASPSDSAPAYSSSTQTEFQAEQPRVHRPLLTECSVHSVHSSAHHFDAPTYSSAQLKKGREARRASAESNPPSVPALAHKAQLDKKKQVERRYSMVSQSNAPHHSSHSRTNSTTNATAPSSLSSSRRQSVSSSINPYASIESLIKLAQRKEIESRYSAKPVSVVDQERRRSIIYELEKEIEKECSSGKKMSGYFSEFWNGFQKGKSLVGSTNHSRRGSENGMEKEEYHKGDETVVWPSSNHQRSRKNSLVSNRKRGQPVLSSTRRERLARIESEEAAGHTE